jgi:hypothetical protein
MLFLLGMKKRLTHWEQVDEPAHDLHSGPQPAKEWRDGRIVTAQIFRTFLFQQ